MYSRWDSSSLNDSVVTGRAQSRQKPEGNESEAMRVL